MMTTADAGRRLALGAATLTAVLLMAGCSGEGRPFDRWHRPAPSAHHLDEPGDVTAASHRNA